MKIIKLYLIVFCTLFILPYSAVMAYEEANYEVVSKKNFILLVNNGVL